MLRPSAMGRCLLIARCNGCWPLRTRELSSSSLCNRLILSCLGLRSFASGLDRTSSFLTWSSVTIPAYYGTCLAVPGCQTASLARWPPPKPWSASSTIDELPRTSAQSFSCLQSSPFLTSSSSWPDRSVSWVRSTSLCTSRPAARITRSRGLSGWSLHRIVSCLRLDGSIGIFRLLVTVDSVD